jgi:hypothetical protein
MTPKQQTQAHRKHPVSYRTLAGPAGAQLLRPPASHSLSDGLWWGGARAPDVASILLVAFNYEWALCPTDTVSPRRHRRLTTKVSCRAGTSSDRAVQSMPRRKVYCAHAATSKLGQAQAASMVCCCCWCWDMPLGRCCLSSLLSVVRICKRPAPG